ncbi:MAG: succinylglutamate desuccinylase/aspartoacylase family protein [Pseudomonadota bacterium]
MALQLDHLDRLPGALSAISVRDIREVFPNPTLVEIAGEHEPPLFISTLLHGNETTSFHVLQLLEERFRNKKPHRSLMIFVGNVAAAEVGLRRLEGEPDFNRIWAHGDTAHHRLAEEVLSAARRRGLFASIDIHNNTGRNPVYGCVNALRPEDLYLAATFAPIGVYYLNPPTTQSIAFSHLAPAITLECGQVGDPDGLNAAMDLIDHMISIDALPKTAPLPEALELFETVGRVLIDPSIRLSFGEAESTDLALREDLEDLNFKWIEQDDLWATTTSNPSGLKVVDEHGSDLTEEFFRRDGDRILLRQRVVPAMITADEAIIRQDCLCYLMKSLR